MNDHQKESSPNRWLMSLYRRPFTLSMFSGVMLCAAFPKWGLWPLALVAPIGWLILIQQRDASTIRRFYCKVWLGSWAHWLGVVYFVIMPHWAGWFGWIAMSLYLSVYYLLFVAGGRALVHRFGIPLIWAAPIAWVAVDWLRAHVITGFGMAMLPHVMFKYPLLIQTADIAGEYFLSFLMIFLTTAVFVEISRQSLHGFAWKRWIPPVAVVVFVFAYGGWRLNQISDSSRQPELVIGLIQGSVDVTFPDSYAEYERIEKKTRDQYRSLTVEARKKWPDLDAVVWPESSFPQPDYLPSDRENELSPDARLDLESVRNGTVEVWKMYTGSLTPPDFPSQLPPFNDSIPLITGGHGIDPVTDEQYNSVIYFSGNGIQARYHKEHLVMFGEYVPLGNYFPFVYRLMPIPGGLAQGKGPVPIRVKSKSGNELVLAPNICFESTVARLVRRHILELRADGDGPVAVLNATNDGWFYGSNCLDLHLACNVFRAIENRIPVLVAANTGFSAHIDGDGKLLSVGPRRKTAVLRAEVIHDPRNSLYQTLGDWPAIMCVLVTIAGLVREVMIRVKRRHPV